MLEVALVEPQRPRLLLKARALLDAVTVPPPYVKQRVAQGQQLPRMEVNGGDEQLVACVKYALGLEGGSGVVLEGQEPSVGMVKEVFVELCEMLVPKWDRANV